MVDGVRSGKVDSSKPWRISHVLEGHTSDVRALCVCDDGDLKDVQFEQFQSASRDETVRTWFREIPRKEVESSTSSNWHNGVRLHGKRYQNAVAHLCLNEEEGLTIMGGLDGRILVYRFKYKDQSDIDRPNQIVHEHYDNVCHLSLSSASRTPKDATRLLISASWDGTSRVWMLVPNDKIGRKLKPLHLLKGHQRSVLDAVIVSAEPGKEKYLTVSADLTIRYWHGEETKGIFKGHSDVIRSIALLPMKDEKDGNELFATSSNDGTIKVWSTLDQQKGEDHSLFTLIPKRKDGTPILDLLFSVRFAGFEAETGNQLLICAGEGGKVYIWNVDTQEQLAQILQPVSTCWDVIFLHLSGDIATADSDGKIRIYTQRQFNSSLLTENERNEGFRELNAEELEEHDRQCQSIVQSNVRADIIATETLAQHSDQNDNVVDGQRFDAILKIDVSDDAEPLSLPINKGDDPRSKAKEFIRKHNLSQNYEDDIVAFIQQVGPR